MRRRDLLAMAAGLAILGPAGGLAQQPNMPVIGVLVLGKPDPGPMLRRFREELSKLGYVEGRNIRIEIRSAEGNPHRLPGLAAELARHRVDVLATWMTPTVLAAKSATTEIPIVMIGVGDPVGMGIVASLARPGGNITGMAALTPELSAKHVELLKEALPDLRRIAALCNASDPFSKTFLEHIEAAGNRQKIEIEPFLVAAGPELAAAFSEMAGKRIGAVIVQPSLPLADIANLALRHHLPAVSPIAQFPRVGGLMAYTNDPGEFYQQAAAFVDKILKGANPADLPVEQPTRIRLVLNLKTAMALGLAVPPSLLARADEVIE